MVDTKYHALPMAPMEIAFSPGKSRVASHPYDPAPKLFYVCANLDHSLTAHSVKDTCLWAVVREQQQEETMANPKRQPVTDEEPTPAETAMHEEPTSTPESDRSAPAKPMLRGGWQNPLMPLYR